MDDNGPLIDTPFTKVAEPTSGSLDDNVPLINTPFTKVAEPTSGRLDDNGLSERGVLYPFVLSVHQSHWYTLPEINNAYYSPLPLERG